MSKADTENAVEKRDADRVNSAVRALQAGELRAMESLLLDVVPNAPSEYVYQFEQDGTRFIKFWDKEEYLHYIVWQKDQGVARPVNWIASAYPRAWYYLGFLKVKVKAYSEAVAALDRGHALESTNPKFNFEKAQALVGLKRHQEALALYEQIDTIGPHVGPHELAVALRGRGFVLIELGDLDRAQAAFMQSLEIEQDNQIAHNELRYIAQLRSGGLAASTDVVPTLAPSTNKCAACGQLFTHGHLATMGGTTIFICEKCRNKETRCWWQFWKNQG